MQTFEFRGAKKAHRFKAANLLEATLKVANRLAAARERGWDYPASFTLTRVA